jgi:hypothetical protein
LPKDLGIKQIEPRPKPEKGNNLHLIKRKLKAIELKKME